MGLPETTLDAFRDELSKIAQAQEEAKPSPWGRLRKAGPAIGTAAGLGYAALTKRPPKQWLAPAFMGTSIGWMPDVAASGVEAARGK